MFSKWWDLLIGILIGLLCAGLILLVSRPKPGTSVLLRPPPTGSPLVINIDGAVQYPGVYSLPPKSRIVDAVESAGGFTENAQPGAINLAASLEDGGHIFVPFSVDPSGSKGDELSTTFGLSRTGEIIPLININQAPVEVLISLPGIGPVTAEKIISYREEHPFSKIEEIQKVPGIGPATYEKMKEYLTVGE
jgi:competence protein ComEA